MEDMFKTLLYIDVVRGEHSTGVAVVPKNMPDLVQIHKVVGPASSLYADYRWQKSLRTTPSRVLIGHNRYATKGAINVANAHPFAARHIIGAHNGTLTNKYNLPNEKKYDTDSEALFNCIADEGIVDAIARVRGAWALTYYDKDTKTINLLRNKERTLYVSSSKDNKTLFWASEAWMLESAARRHGIEIETPVLLKEDVLFTVDVSRDEVSNGVVKPVEGAPKLTPLQEYQDKSTRYTDVLLEAVSKSTQGVSEFINLVMMEPAPAEIDSITLYLGKLTPEHPEVGDIVRATVVSYREGHGYVLPQSLKIVGKVQEVTYADHRGAVISRAEFEKLYSYCAWCSSDIDPDAEDNAMQSNGDILCGHCAKQPDIAKFLGAY